MALHVTGKRVDPVKGYNFLITLVDSSSLLTVTLSGIQNAAVGGFSECSGLEMALQVEEYREGGNNGTVLKFPTRTTWGNIRLRRGVVASDDLWKWHYSFVEGKGTRRDGTIILQNDAHQPVRVWNFTRGLPVKWTGPAMNATQGQVAVEELEIAHEGVKLSSPAAALANAIKSLF
jgi:phage tail-like protein